MPELDNPPLQQDRLLTPAEAGGILGVSGPVLRRHRRKWGIPAVKVGRELKFPERELRAWIANRPAA